MLPGPTIIRKCSKCNEKMGESTILSGNTCGAECWTDGFMLAPMLPQNKWLVKCPHCESLLWLDELENLGELNFEDSQDAYLNLATFNSPDVKDFFNMLDKINNDLEKELYLRQRLWWRWNDKRRYIDKIVHLTEDEKQNLEKLAVLLNAEVESERLLIGEIFRELGQFARASEILKEPFSEEYQDIANFLKNLINRKQTFVVKVD